MRAWQELCWWRWAKSSRPILVGPWRSEVGFETLYWLPWVDRWCRRFHIPADRLVAISRGGASAWYGAGQSVELYDHVPLDVLRKAMLADAAAVGSVKQLRATAWEQALIPLIAQGLGIRRYHLLHPSAMYQQLTPWWHDQMSVETLQRALSFTPLPVPAAPLSLPLPERYVAVRFYARHTWPPTDDLRAWVASLVDGLAKRLPVVVLDHGLHTDDHVDFPLEGPNILTLKGHCTPQNNLAVQSAVLAKAQAFVGTYGGTMQLAVRLKKPAMGFYEKFEGTAPAHKNLVERLGMQQKTTVFIGRPDDARMVRDVLLGV